MVERSYGVAGNYLKWPKNQEITVTHGGLRRRFAGPIRARPAVAGCEITSA